ncbi:hypothetical protein H4R20_006024 [Coemansia guatemalensis]|uniref:Mid2 domain-containing protein n=1 Tax=Coemansia guatemalensis TaxID=2761395 RepID=A0A9W8LR93_9FUNG|nr:hypothetical protein H4R20_006024 [Coemansia guatemalensis]
MRVSKALCRALAATVVVLATTATAEDHPASDTDRSIAVQRGRHPRGLLDGLAGILNIGRAGEDGNTNTDNTVVGKADETDGNSGSDNGDNTSNNTDDDNNDSTSHRPTDDSSSGRDSSNADDSTSDRESTSDRSTEHSDRTSDNTDRTSDHHSPTDSDSGAESESESSSRTRPNSDTETEPTDSPTPTDESSSMVVVTATRPGVTTTTMVGPAPTIDDANGDKADVGTSGNLTSIIVASSVTAAALLLCTVLFYLYRRRKNRMTHGEEDFFAKGPLGGSPLSGADNTVTTTSPFIPPAQPSGDGYVKPEDNTFYGAGAITNGRRTEDSFRSQPAVSDNTHLLANQQYRPAATAPVTVAAAAPYVQPATNPHYQPQTTAPPAPPILQATAPPTFHAAAPAQYGVRPPQQRMQVAGYPNVPMQQQRPLPQQRSPPQPRQQPQQQHSLFSPLQHNHGSTGP